MYPCLLLKVLAEYDLQLCACRKKRLLCGLCSCTLCEWIHAQVTSHGGGGVGEPRAGIIYNPADCQPKHPCWSSNNQRGAAVAVVAVIVFAVGRLVWSLSASSSWSWWPRSCYRRHVVVLALIGPGAVGMSLPEDAVISVAITVPSSVVVIVVRVVVVALSRS